MASKKIEPTNPALTTTDAETKETAGRKTANFKFRKLASVRFGRKTNSFKY